MCETVNVCDCFFVLRKNRGRWKAKFLVANEQTLNLQIQEQRNFKKTKIAWLKVVCFKKEVP